MTTLVTIKNKGPQKVRVFQVERWDDPNDCAREEYRAEHILEKDESVELHMWKNHSLEIYEIQE
jgi:hypothetical protein